MRWSGERSARQRRIVGRFVLGLFAGWWGLVGALVCVNPGPLLYLCFTDSGGTSTTDLAMAKISQRVDLYQLRKKRHPDTLATAFNGQAVPADGWGRPFVYVVGDDGASYDIVSRGADGRPGGTGDAADIRWSVIRAPIDQEGRETRPAP